MKANYENVKTLMHLERGTHLVSSSGESLNFVLFDDEFVFCTDSKGIYRSFRLEDVEFTKSVVQSLVDGFIIPADEIKSDEPQRVNKDSALVTKRMSLSRRGLAKLEKAYRHLQEYDRTKRYHHVVKAEKLINELKQGKE